MKLLSILIVLTLALDGPVSFGTECKELKQTCLEMSEAYETAVSEQRLAMQAQDGVIANLREQRDLALKSSGPTLLDWALPLLIGAAGAVVLIGIRR